MCESSAAILLRTEQSPLQGRPVMSAVVVQTRTPLEDTRLTVFFRVQSTANPNPSDIACRQIAKCIAINYAFVCVDDEQIVIRFPALEIHRAFFALRQSSAVDEFDRRKH